MLGSFSFSRTRNLHISRFAASAAAATLVLLALAACDETVVEVKPSSGVIEVTALTDGTGPVPDSFRISINGGESGSIAANGQVTFTSLPRGRYHVALVEEAENCWYGVNGRIVTVELEKTSYTTFLVRCR
jgi:hypothetical protein